MDNMNTDKHNTVYNWKEIISNKEGFVRVLNLYKDRNTLKPIWTYGIQLWGTAANSNFEMLQRYLSKILRIIINAP